MKKSHLRLYGPLSVLALLALIVFVTALVVGAQRIDNAERLEEESLVRSDVPRRMVEVADSLKPFFLWDEAVERLDNRRDVAWAHDNVGSLSHSPLYSRVLVVDGDDMPLYAAIAGHDSDVRTAHVSASTRSAISEVRAREGRPLPPVTTPVRATRFAMIHGRPMVVIANLVRSDTGQHKPAKAHAPILVAETPVDVALRQAFSQRFRLLDLRTVVSGGDAAGRGATVALDRTPDGQVIKLVWTPKRPGFELLARSALLLGGAMLALLGAGSALVAHGRRTARRLVESQEEARRLALHDPLTGLANRLLLQDRLRQARDALRRRPGQVAVLCLDLDRFKEVNDTYGHEAGDELIQEVGRRLQAVCRKEDTVARLGGDEFAIVQSRCEGAAGAAAHAERVVQALSGSVQLSAGPAVLSCSIGVAVIDDAEVESAEVMRQADLALYRAKDRGRGRYCFFEPEMDQALRARKALEHDLRRMVAGGGPEVHYQPLVDVEGSIVGAEALARWSDPVRGPVPPSTFIRLAEECGLIGSIGERVLRRACEDSLAWPELRVAINLSPVQLRQPGLVETLERILAETGACCSRMDLEITEGVLLRDDPATHTTLSRLRAMGFQLALDDFGTGYSSLSYLNTYPVQKLKLDRAFTTGLEVSAESRAIASAVLTMAKALNLNVLAEGIETKGQFEILRDLGCREFQGYLFGRPAPGSAISELRQKGATRRPGEDVFSGPTAPGR